MKVLITGGYGFIGSFVAEKFYAEGHDVYIIDNLIAGSKNNVKFKHKFCDLHVEDPNCELLFRANKFDVVIHLAAQVNVGVSMEEPYSDAKTNVLGVTNMLQLSKKYGVKKVVFASSAAVYGLNKDIPLKEDSLCDPLSPYGMNKWVGELYCKKWMEVFDLPTLCFRFSNVYGPKQGGVGEGGVVSIFIDRVLQGKEIVVFGDGEQTRDFIYVQDVAEAIYRGVEYDLQGIYNLSTNTEISVNQLIDELNKMGGVKEVTFEEEKYGDIKYSRLDNSRIKNDLDWVPLHNFKEGLEKTYQWFASQRSEMKNQKTTEKNPKWMTALKPSIPYFENVGIFVLALLLSNYLQDSLYMIDFILFYIVVSSYLLGRSQSILSISIGSIWFLYAHILNGRELISLMVDHNTLVHMGLYMFVGLTIGFVLDKKEKLIQNSRTEVDYVTERYQFLNDVYHETLTIKDELQNQVLYTNDSFGMVYSIMKELDYLDPLKTYAASIKIVENVMKSNEVAFYIVDQSKETGRLVAQSDGLKVHPSQIIAESASFLEVKQTNRMYVNKSLDPNHPSMIAPILIEGNFIGVLCIYKSNFEYLTLFNQNLLTVTTNLISAALNCAYQHQDALNMKTNVERKFPNLPPGSHND